MIAPDLVTARQQVGEQVDGPRACATLIAETGPLEFSADLMGSASVGTFADAGLITLQPLPNAAGDRPRVRIVAGPAGRADIRMRQIADGGVLPELRFGKRRLTAVRVESDGAGGQRLRYRYSIVDAPAWTADPAIRRTFPFLVHLLDGEREAREAAFLKDGRWIIPDNDPTNMSAEIGNKGFMICEVPYPDPQSPCN